ncbi:hypothetical protein BD413DRAFT_490561 [Trametes elegans]|nr:hypothetical protein BD413DRAFT_490561 [Trametes elegans]
MAVTTSEVRLLLKELKASFPGDHTVYAWSRENGYHTVHGGHPGSVTFTGPAAAVIPNVIIKSRTPASRAYRPIMDPRLCTIDVASLLPLNNLVEIAGLLPYGHTSAFLQADSSLVAWGPDLRGAHSNLKFGQKALDIWYRRHTASDSGPTVNVDQGCHDFDYLVEVSSVPEDAQREAADFFGYTSNAALPPLPLLDSLLHVRTLHRSSNPVPSYANAISPRAMANSPMLADSPAGFTFAGPSHLSARMSPEPGSYLSSASTSPCFSSGTESGDSVMATPATNAPSDFSPSPLIRVGSSTFEDMLFQLDEEYSLFPESEGFEGFKPLESPLSLSSPSFIDLPLSPAPPPALDDPPLLPSSPSPSPTSDTAQPTTVEIRVVPPPADIPSCSPKTRGRKGKAVASAASPSLSSTRVLRPRRAVRPPRDAPLPSTSTSAPSVVSRSSLLPATPLFPACITSKAPVAPEPASSRTRVIRPLPSRSLRNRTAHCSSATSPTHSSTHATRSSAAGAERASSWEDEGDEDAEGVSDCEGDSVMGREGQDEGGDEDESGDYRPRATASRGSKKRVSKRSHDHGDALSRTKKRRKGRTARTLCPFPGCNQSFVRSHDCERHQTQHWPLEERERLREETRCPRCGKTFSRVDAMQRHFRGACHN